MEDKKEEKLDLSELELKMEEDDVSSMVKIIEED
jgi:hypothetical protein